MIKNIAQLKKSLKENIDPNVLGKMLHRYNDILLDKEYMDGFDSCRKTCYKVGRNYYAKICKVNGEVVSYGYAKIDKLQDEPTNFFYFKANN